LTGCGIIYIGKLKGGGFMAIARKGDECLRSKNGQ